MNFEQQLINNLINSNPQIAQIMNELNKSGKSPKDFFYDKAKEKGVNPDDILKTLQGLNIKF